MSEWGFRSSYITSHTGLMTSPVAYSISEKLMLLIWMILLLWILFTPMSWN